MQLNHPAPHNEIDWAGWEAVIRTNGYAIDRPENSIHPTHGDIRYPLDYGYIRDTEGLDGQEVDLFVGSGNGGLVGIMFTTDFRKMDEEYKFLFNCTAREIYLAHGFINFDRSLMSGELVLRHPMADLWGD